MINIERVKKIDKFFQVTGSKKRDTIYNPAVGWHWTVCRDE